MNALILKEGREKSLKRRHPWIFSGAVERVTGDPNSGDSVEVRSAEGATLAIAAYSPGSQIRARVWSFDPKATTNAEYFNRRVKQALALRAALPAAKHTNALRLVHGESDGLPGVIVDRYADVLAVQFLSAGAERWREAILDALVEATHCEAVFERSDAEVRRLEGLEPRVGFARGNRNANNSPVYVPPLMAITIYCWPLSMYVMGEPLWGAGMKTEPTSLPVALS